MYRIHLNRKKETQARAGQQQQANTPAVPVSQASSSPAASLSSNTSSSMAHVVSPSISSRSDSSSADHSVTSRAPSTSPKNRFFSVSISPGPRPTSPAPMGQTNSSVDSAPHSPVSQLYPLSVSASPPPSNPLKRIWGNRRKKSEDVTSIFAASQDSNHDKGKERAYDASAMSSMLSTPATSVDDLQVQNDVDVAYYPSRTKRLLQLQISPKKLPQIPKALKFSGSPPIPPPKNEELQVRKEPSRSELRLGVVPPPVATNSSLSTTAVQSSQSQGPSLSPSWRDKTDADLKQDWRKSDSTVMSYVTIRPGALTNGRSTRPVSLAESSHSGHTVVPVNKRFSALITDAEFAMLEERDSDTEEDVIPITFTGRPSPTSSVKARNRRSASLNLGSGHLSKAFESPILSGSAMPRLSRTLTDMPMLRDTTSTAPVTTVAAPTGTKQWTVTTPAQSAKANSRNQPAAWSTPTSDRTAPVQQQTRRPTAPNQTRQPKVSIVGGGFAPVAFGLGRRAAEKVQRVWEGLSTSSAQSTHSASSSNIVDSNRAASRQSIYGLQSSLPGAWKHQRRTPNGPSGSWSISSSIASGESDSFVAPAGPALGPCLRGPKRNASGTAVIGGMVFGRDLRTCVRETAIDGVRAKLSGDDEPIEVADVKSVEQRLLPAIVVRCYEHLMKWGLQEEGLFRINGRASHVAKLRSEFDTGADYELVKSDLGDLDPHAVSSIFKAYLRELPESLLTDALVPLFESSLPKGDSTAQHATSPPRTGLGLRKPPSLSTLAMPSFAVHRTVSNETTRAMSTLIAQLPVENRDLLYTVVELVNATATASKETKMPLGNLLLLFCPSLGVSHALLRVLCEAKDIWTPPAKGDDQTPALPEISGKPQASSGSSSINNDSSSSFSITDSESDISSLPAARPRGGKRRGPVATMLDVPSLSMYRTSAGSAQDDTASYMSALDGSPSNSNNSSTHLPALSTSTDSIATPSTMSEVSSLQQSSTPYPTSEPKKDASSIPSPEEPLDDLSLSEPRRRPLISSPIPFPSSGEGSPCTPSSPRKSLALLSFPPLGKSDPSGPGNSATWAHRPKRPSLTMLFSKKSMSSLTSSSPSQPRKDSCGTPVDVIHIRPTTPAAPPVLDTPISSSPIHLFEFAETKSQQTAHPDVTAGDLLSVKDSDWHGREHDDSSSGSSLFSTPQQTPIADYFRSRSKSFISLIDDKDVKSSIESPKVYSAKASPMASSSQVSLTPSLDVGIESTVEENWAQSVLNEAEATSGSKSRWRMSKLF
ncbi:hypothetical protein BDY19DRAFT_994379 [Irpex rosettiformis]|uniref:Uncharacterized protein n=1 Tax=Irpex rosettiformis TaxID=378272 RepID=A0ACB8U0S1_9APHY|nr:hypothetical protein BDY19DRAFT_994379 [Irpex rosettiformis]